MSVQTALQFIQYLRDNDELKSQCFTGCKTVSLDQLVLLAKQSGFNCSADDLVRAHKHDWAIRWRALNRQREQRETKD